MLLDNQKAKHLVKVIAHLMGDGCVSKKYFAYYNTNNFLLEDFKKSINYLFGDIHFITGKVNSGTPFVMVQNKTLFQFLTSIVPDYRSFALKIPHFINTPNLKKEFLSALFDDEGCASLRIFKKTGELKRDITIASKSRQLISEIKEILLQDFAIYSNKINRYVQLKGCKEFEIYKLTITGKENFIKFRDKINFNTPIKQERVDKIISSYIRK